MKIDVTQVLTDLDNNPLIDTVDDGKGNAVKKPVTVRTISRVVLTAQFKGDEPDGAEKYRRGGLALKIVQNDVVDLDAEDIAMLKKLAGIGYTATIVFPFFNALEKRVPEEPAANV